MKSFAVLSSVLVFAVAASAKKEVGCYWGTWAFYRPGDGKFDVPDIGDQLFAEIANFYQTMNKYNVIFQIPVFATTAIMVLRIWTMLLGPSRFGIHGMIKLLKIVDQMDLLIVIMTVTDDSLL